MANYPTSASSFSTKNPGDSIAASHINDLQTEIAAIEAALLNGLAHHLKPNANNTYDLGVSGTGWRDLFVGRNATIGGTLGVTGNIVSDLIFTDATYDIGKSGATRPRDGFFSRNVAAGGTLTSSGRLGVNSPSDLASEWIGVIANTAAINGIVLKNSAAHGQVGSFIRFLNSSGAVAGQIDHSASTTVAYTTSSDRRLKHDHGPATDVTALRALRVHDAEWKASGERYPMLFAQEAVGPAPFAVSVGSDCEGGEHSHPWMVDYSKLVPLLVAGWQAHEARLAKLEGA